jgi:hypothetical protein
MREPMKILDLEMQATMVVPFSLGKCLNCPEWMRLGAESQSAPHVFCCRVAFNRKMKREVAA